jgi:hypothetical protein
MSAIKTFYEYHEAVLFLQTDESKGLLFLAYRLNANHNSAYQFWKPSEFVVHYERLKHYQRYYHEYSICGQPVRLTFDIETKKSMKVMPNLEQWNLMIDVILQTEVEKHIAQLCNGRVITKNDREVWHAHRNNKMSTHVYYDIWLATPRDALFIAERCKESQPQFLSMIDLGIYAVNDSPKSLRMPYSSRLIMENQLDTVNPLFKDPTAIAEKFDRHAFIRSIMSSVPPAGEPIYAVTDPTFEPRFKGLDERVNFMDHVDDETKERVRRQLEPIHYWLMEFKGVKRLTPFGSSHDSLTWRISPVHCELKWAPHNSNGVLFTVYFDPNFEITTSSFFCLDCKTSWNSEIPIDYIVFPEKYSESFQRAVEEFEECSSWL